MAGHKHQERLGAASAQTSARMRKVRQRGTGPELVVRRLLTSLGFRYRICANALPGRPDIANQTGRWCVFVHGCFWHGHKNCRLAHLPASNRTWWHRKINDNRRRDARNERHLRDLGFSVVLVWQCELRDENAITRRLRSLLPRNR